MATILLTGGAGYVGSHIALNLLTRIAEVIVLPTPVSVPEIKYPFNIIFKSS